MKIGLAKILGGERKGKGNSHGWEFMREKSSGVDFRPITIRSIDCLVS
jgi:hypothetical protein